MNQYNRAFVFVLCLFFQMINCASSVASPVQPARLLSNVGDTPVLQMRLRIERVKPSAKYILSVCIFNEDQAVADSFTIGLTMIPQPDNLPDSMLQFDKGQEERLAELLKPYQDVYTRYNVQMPRLVENKSDLTNFINVILRQYHPGGIEIFKIPASANHILKLFLFALLLFLGGIATGLILFFIVRKRRQKKRGLLITDNGKSQTLEEQSIKTVESKLDALVEPDKTGSKEDAGTGEIAGENIHDAAENKKEKKYAEQKEQKPIAYNVLVKNMGEKIREMSGLQSQLKEQTEALTVMKAQNDELQNKNIQLASELAKSTGGATSAERNQKIIDALQQYFAIATTKYAIPFSELDTSGLLNPSDPKTLHRLIELMITQAVQYFALTRYFSERMDANDAFNLKKCGFNLIEEDDANNRPIFIPVDSRNGFPTLLLSLAEILRQYGGEGENVDVNIRGYSFTSKS